MKEERERGSTHYSNGFVSKGHTTKEQSQRQPKVCWGERLRLVVGCIMKEKEDGAMSSHLIHFIIHNHTNAHYDADIGKEGERREVVKVLNPAEQHYWDHQQAHPGSLRPLELERNFTHLHERRGVCEEGGREGGRAHLLEVLCDENQIYSTEPKLCQDEEHIDHMPGRGGRGVDDDKVGGGVKEEEEEEEEGGGREK